MKVGQNNS